MGIFNWLSSSTSLVDAVRSGNIRSTRSFLKKGTSQKELDKCLNYAQHEGLRMVKLLVEHGANVNYIPSGGRKPPLHLAAVSGYQEIASYLIENGADVNLQDHEGDTPLDSAYEIPLEVEILSLRGGNGTSYAMDKSVKERQKIADLLTANGGKGGHLVPPQMWGPLKSRITPLILYARSNFPSASTEELSQKILDKIDLQFSPNENVDRIERVKKEVTSLIVKKLKNK